MKKPAWKNLSDHEKEMVLVYRGKKETGYPIHKTDEGHWYFWCMGLQDHPEKLVQPTIGEAVHAFLKYYHPLTGHTFNPHFCKPIPRK